MDARPPVAGDRPEERDTRWRCREQPLARLGQQSRAALERLPRAISLADFGTAAGELGPRWHVCTSLIPVDDRDVNGGCVSP